MDNRVVFLLVTFTLGLAACDSETVRVLPDADSSVESTSNSGNNSTADSNANNSTANTDAADVVETPTNSQSDNSQVSTDSNGLLSSPDELVSLVGLVKVEATNTTNDFSRGVFTRLETALTAERVLRSFVPSADFCQVTRYNAAFPPGNPLKIYDQEPTLISAGESVTLSNSSGTYALLERQIVEGTGLIYKSNTTLSENIPSNLVLNVPGEVFPGFDNIAVSGVPAVQVVAPTQAQRVTTDTAFRWNANSDPLSVFEIYAGVTAPETNQVTFVGCSLVDDGQFSFDAAIRAELGEDFSADWFSALRVVYDVEESDGALLFIANSVN